MIRSDLQLDIISKDFNMSQLLFAVANYEMIMLLI